MKPKIGLKESDQKKIADHLCTLLANTYSLYLKTQNYHWNLVSPHFSHDHLLFEKQYEELADAIDEIAERIRSLGQFVDARFSVFQKQSSVKDAKPDTPAEKMILELLEAHEEICRKARPLIHFSQDLLDDVTADLVIRRLAFHEKASWMLRSSL